MRSKRLDTADIHWLIGLSEVDGFPCKLTESAARSYCAGRAPDAEGVQTYGIYDGDCLAAVMTATFCVVFPCDDSPSGRIVHISGAFTRPEYRHRGYACELLSMIEADARSYAADYICCDSTADGLYLSFGFVPAPEKETRMWKSVHILKEESE